MKIHIHAFDPIVWHPEASGTYTLELHSPDDAQGDHNHYGKLEITVTDYTTYPTPPNAHFYTIAGTLKVNMEGGWRINDETSHCDVVHDYSETQHPENTYTDTQRIWSAGPTFGGVEAAGIYEQYDTEYARQFYGYKSYINIHLYFTKRTPTLKLVSQGNKLLAANGLNLLVRDA